ncbi:helix-turn-helix domain-containing protein [Scytonema sp. UIC 10036]|uniref:helix-turn-helix domain-containing protein n=1 Tax=Scytonema sp. UIC 10036 TaxID=2304196 RepID=UPI0012DA884B|nr:helix-turn-helix domain-containing protein [Scytonema sp. UIC 10036]MUG94309.1 helix-turn-helix domain-containing protein [Scytonema sp. UIC 10036]
MENQSQLLTPFQRKLLMKKLEADLRPEYRRRIQIMLMADTGQTQTHICAELGCSQETARYWIEMARAGKAHLWEDRPMGRPKTVNAQYLNRLKELVSHSPREYGYPFQRWTARWLGKHLAKELGIEMSDRYISMLLKKMGLSTRSQSEINTTDTSEINDSIIAIRDLPSSVEASSAEYFAYRPILSKQDSHTTLNILEIHG